MSSQESASSVASPVIWPASAKDLTRGAMHLLTATTAVDHHHLPAMDVAVLLCLTAENLTTMDTVDAATLGLLTADTADIALDLLTTLVGTVAALRLLTTVTADVAVLLARMGKTYLICCCAFNGVVTACFPLYFSFFS